MSWFVQWMTWMTPTMMNDECIWRENDAEPKGKFGTTQITVQNDILTGFSIDIYPLKKMWWTLRVRHAKTVSFPFVKERWLKQPTMFIDLDRDLKSLREGEKRRHQEQKKDNGKKGKNETTKAGTIGVNHQN